MRQQTISIAERYTDMFQSRRGEMPLIEERDNEHFLAHRVWALGYIDIGGKMQNAVIFDTLWRKFYPHDTELPVQLERFRAGSREFPMMREPSLASCFPASLLSVLVSLKRKRLLSATALMQKER
jgi:hypothetical protein